MGPPLLVGHHRGHVDAQHPVGDLVGPRLQLPVDHEPRCVVRHAQGVGGVPALRDGQRNGHQPPGMARLVQRLQVPPDGLEGAVVAQVVGPRHDDAGGVGLHPQRCPQAGGRLAELVLGELAVHVEDHLIGSPSGHADLIHLHPELLGHDRRPGTADPAGEEPSGEAVPAAEYPVGDGRFLLFGGLRLGLAGCSFRGDGDRGRGVQGRGVGGDHSRGP
mmetsp:Transcript_139006/g.241773  ORF Transcript_139006/g.241773 Transcript_139006/m.241773 type:complete len:218 (-) Transcript_139006:484-1137(-)